LSSSDGYKSDYRYNADVSGRGRITGPIRPARHDLLGRLSAHTTITYADGSTERIDGWGSGYGGEA
jgi:hypothetical protein